MTETLRAGARLSCPAHPRKNFRPRVFPTMFPVSRGTGREVRVLATSALVATGLKKAEAKRLVESACEGASYQSAGDLILAAFRRGNP